MLQEKHCTTLLVSSCSSTASLLPLVMPRAEAYGSSFVCLSVSHYAEGGATEAYCNRAVCQSVCQSVSLSFTSISRRSLKTKR